MNNIFTSTKISWVASNTKADELSLGEARAHSRAIPPLVYQLKETIMSRKKEWDRAIKGAMLKYDNIASNLLTLSVYDSNCLFHY